MDQQNTPQSHHTKPTTTDQKTRTNKTNWDIRQGLWLTEAQKIYIQYKLPKLYSLIPVSTNSRLALNSKLLEEESINFARNKRGRKEGSCLKNITESPTKSRKSMRISSRKQTFDLKQSGSESEQSERNEQLYSVSYAKQLQFSKSVSRLDAAGDLNESNIGEKQQQMKDKSGKEQQKAKRYSVGVCEAKCFDKQVNDKKADRMGKESNAAKQNIKKTAQQATIIAAKQQQIPLVIQSDRVAIEPIADNKQPPQQQLLSKQIPPQIIHHTAKQQQEEQQSKIADSLFAPQMQILNKLKTHENILPFLEPVDETRDGAPDYYSIITDPIDIQTIEFKLNNNIYKEPAEFHLDITKMWNNARTYNIDNKFMLRVTNSLQKYYSKLAKTPLCSHNKPKNEKEKKAAQKAQERSE